MTQRRNVKARRIYDPALPEDGTRVLVDRIWPRGVSKARAQLDEWCKDIAPSTELRKWYSHDPALFEEFARRYRDELSESTRAARTRASARSGEETHADAAHRHQERRPERGRGPRRSRRLGQTPPRRLKPPPAAGSAPRDLTSRPGRRARRLNDCAPVRHSLRVWLLLPSRRVPPRAAATRSALVAAGSGWDRRR